VIRVARNPIFSQTIQFVGEGLVENFTKNWTGESLIFYPVFILSSSRTHHLATFNKILFTKDSLPGIKCIKIILFSAGALFGATMLPQTS